MTRSMGDLHHFAWKADSPEWVAYGSDDDAKYSHWNAHECSSRYCIIWYCLLWYYMVPYIVGYCLAVSSRSGNSAKYSHRRPTCAPAGVLPGLVLRALFEPRLVQSSLV